LGHFNLVAYDAAKVEVAQITRAIGEAWLKDEIIEHANAPWGFTNGVD
jgi:hypothetical protein